MITYRGSAADHRQETIEPAEHPSRELEPAPYPSPYRQPRRHLPTPALATSQLRKEAALSYENICPDGHSTCIIVDPNHLILRYANVQGRALLHKRYPARLNRGVVEITSERGALLVRDALRQVRETANPMLVVSDGELGAFSVSISLWAPPEQLRSGASVAILDFRVGAFELSRHQLWAIGMGFSLTEAETAVLGHLVEGLTLTQIALARRVELETVRSQCKTVLAKMGCHRQVDLVRLMISLCAGATFVEGA